MTAADAPEDFVDFIACLEAERCDFLVIGAHALAAHGLARATGDLDVLVRSDRNNATRVYLALLRFGAPLAAHQVAIEDFSAPGTVYQMGLPPRRIDVLTSISGVSFDEAVEHAVVAALGPERVRCIGLEAMIRNKRIGTCQGPGRRRGAGGDSSAQAVTASASCGSTSPARPSTRTAQRSSPRALPRLTVATGMPSSTARSRKR